MAATGTPTPNIGLRIPLGTDPASVDDINYNSTLIDTKLGAVGNESVQDQLDDLNSKITTQTTLVVGNTHGLRIDVKYNACSYSLIINGTLDKNFVMGTAYILCSASLLPSGVNLIGYEIADEFNTGIGCKVYNSSGNLVLIPLDNISSGSGFRVIITGTN